MTWHDDEQPGRRRRRRPPPRLSEANLEAAAARYLRRFWAPTASLRRILNKRVHAAVQAPGPHPGAGAAMVEALLQRLTDAGVLDDANYATERARQLHERGIPSRRIHQRLREKGLASEHIDEALATLTADEPDADLLAAHAYARRRRLGPHRLPEARKERRKRDLAAMARAGFSYDLTLQVIDATGLEPSE